MPDLLEYIVVLTMSPAGMSYRAHVVLVVIASYIIYTTYIDVSFDPRKHTPVSFVLQEIQHLGVATRLRAGGSYRLKSLGLKKRTAHQQRRSKSWCSGSGKGEVAARATPTEERNRGVGDCGSQAKIAKAARRS